MINIIIIFILLYPVLFTYDADAKIKETPHYDVVAEYIRSLGAIHNLQQIANKELEAHKDNPTQKMLDGIRSATRFKLELSASINTLKGMTLKEPFNELIQHTISFYKYKKELFNETIEISKNLLDGVAKPGVDYSKMLARMPEITASIDYLDEKIFRSMDLVFALLIDEKPEGEGHTGHLNITKAQRQTLIDSIDAFFGESLYKKNQNWTVLSAIVLKEFLLKDYKCRDE